MNLAGIYARISLDVAGESLGVQRQVADCTAKAASMGWTLAETYTDNDVSASKDVPRPSYARMLADLEAGRINAVVVYDLDRLTRKPAELEHFITLADRHGISLANVSGDVDLTTASGRMVARIKGAVARQEAERLGERVKRQKQQRLSDGLPPGSRYRTFGYSRDWTIVESEAAVVRDVFAAVVAGESVNSITKRLFADGVQTVSGKPWRYQATTRMLESPIYAGLLSYKGEVTGKSKVPALISEGMYEAAQGRETKPGWNTRASLLASIAVCDVCKTPMSSGGDVYVCSRIQNGCGNVSVRRQWLDDVINAYMSFMVMNTQVWNPTDAPVAEEVSEDPVAKIDAEIDAARNAHDAGDLALEDLLPMLKAMRAKRSQAVKAAKSAVEEKVAWQPVADYDKADISMKRAEIRKHLAAIMIRPATKGRNTPDENRAYVLRTDGTTVPLAAINVIDYREHIPGYEGALKIEDRMPKGWSRFPDGYTPED